MKRRNFLVKSFVGSVGLTALGSLDLKGENSTFSPGKKKLQIGICTDLHHDLITDGEQRLQAFIEEMNVVKPDFIIQNGDFCVPKPKNQSLLNIWNKFKGPKHHVLGNHDTDGGFTQDQVIDFWNSKGKYYSFDINGYHIVILNGNERLAGDTSKGYPRSVSPEQLLWLVKDLDGTSLPVIVFCHQGIDNDLDGLKEGNLVRIAFERANQKAGFQKVWLVFSGHHHEDYHNVYNNIHYVQINSMSYQFAHLKNDYTFAHTKDPLWALVTLYEDGTVKIKGRKSTYANTDAWVAYNGYPVVPFISDRVLSLKNDKFKSDTQL